MNIEVSRLKATISNPESSSERKENAIAELRALSDTNLDARLVLRELGLSKDETPARAANGTLSPLEKDLLIATHKADIRFVDYLEIHQFCTENGWDEDEVKALYFDRWLPAYFQTDEGSRKLAKLESYKMMADASQRGEKPNLGAIDALVEVRRRLRTDPEFRQMFVDGCKTEEDLAFIKLLTVNLLDDEVPA
jgi:hypothetical protein